MKPGESLGIMHRRRFDLGRSCLWLLLALLPVQIIAAPPTGEYKLKAALIYKLSKFVDWPVSAGAGKNGTFGICVLGKDPFGSALDAIAARKTGGQPIRIHRLTQSKAIDRRCQIVFISESKRAFMQPILQSLRQRPILTLSDTNNFAEQGGIMQFTRGDKRIGFKINLGMARKSGLEIAAPLLELSKVIGSP